MSALTVILGVLSIVCMAVSGLVGTLTTWRMIDELNKTRPASQKFTTIGWRGNFEVYDVLSEYRRLYPDSALLRRLRRSYACSLIAVTVVGGITGGVLGAVWLGLGGVALGWLTWRVSSPRTS
jgi:hypothetical protein